MKNKFIILFCLTVLVCIAIFWLGHRKEQSKSLHTETANSPSVENPIAARNQEQPGVSKQDTDASVRQATISASATPEERAAKMNTAIEAKNIPFDFYGRAIDQDSNSLSGVKFKIALRHWSITSWGGIHIERETDADGRFDIHGETGDGFDIEAIGKDGYELEPGQRSFGAVGGNNENPVFFKMWSTNIHEKLITGVKSFHIIPDGRPYFINLTDDTISESAEGDLKVWIQYTNQVVRGQLCDWTCEIDVNNGGLLEESLGTAMYIAPTEGYVPIFQFHQQIKGGQTGSIGERRFYFISKNGQAYGRMSIEMIAPYNIILGIPGMIRLSYAVNPSGSRILR
jgi:hypothetical protein